MDLPECWVQTQPCSQRSHVPTCGPGPPEGTAAGMACSALTLPGLPHDFPLPRLLGGTQLSAVVTISFLSQTCRFVLFWGTSYCANQLSDYESYTSDNQRVRGGHSRAGPLLRKHPFTPPTFTVCGTHVLLNEGQCLPTILLIGSGLEILKFLYSSREAFIYQVKTSFN